MHICQLVIRKVIFIKWHLCSLHHEGNKLKQLVAGKETRRVMKNNYFEVFQEAQFFWNKKKEGSSSSALSSSCSAYSVNVLLQGEVNVISGWGNTKTEWRIKNKSHHNWASRLTRCKEKPWVQKKSVGSGTLGSSGGSYWMIQSTAGMSRPLAATSVQSRMPFSALQKSK